MPLGTGKCWYLDVFQKLGKGCRANQNYTCRNYIRIIFSMVRLVVIRINFDEIITRTITFTLWV